MIHNEKIPLLVKIASPVAMLCAAVASVLYGISYYTAYDTDVRHYSADCIMVRVAFGLLVASAILCALCGLSLRGKYSVQRRGTTQIESFMLWLTAFMFLGFAVVSVLNGENVDAVSKFGNICVKAIPWLSVASAIPFICASSSRLSGGFLHGLSSMVTVFWAAAIMFKYYFDLHEVPLNDPELALTIASLAAVILFFLSECRIALGIEVPGISVFSASVCICIGGFVSVARIVLGLTVEGGLLIPTLMESIITLTIAALAVARLSAVLDGTVIKEETDEENN